MTDGGRKLKISISELERAFENLSMGMEVSSDSPSAGYLNLETGEIVWPETDEESEECWGADELLSLPEDLWNEGGFVDVEDFIRSLEEGPIREELAGAIQGKGAFRRFKNIVLGGGDIELMRSWDWFETRRQRERIVDWLRSENIDPQWDTDIFQPPQFPDKRPELLRAALKFVRAVRKIKGVRRIALLGSLTTDKPTPKDLDLLVEVSDDAPLNDLAHDSRRLRAQATETGDSCGADVFVCNPQGEYLGRLCSWSQCESGIRQSCEARNCGRREYLYDDLQNLTLGAGVVAEPPLELWPRVVARVDLPEDVISELVNSLKEDGAK